MFNRHSRFKQQRRNTHEAPNFGKIYLVNYFVSIPHSTMKPIRMSRKYWIVSILVQGKKTLKNS